jgi:hypothetical protein
MLYRCLSGHLPFNAEEIAPLLVAILLEVPKPLRELVPDIDRELAAIVMRSMARRADDRYQTAAEFLEDLTIWEKAHAGSLDVAMVPSGMTSVTRTNQIGTAATWAQSGDQQTQEVRKKTMRTGLWVVAFSLVGVVTLLAAGKFLMSSSSLAAETATSATVPAPNTSVAVAAAEGAPVAVVPVVPAAAPTAAPLPSIPATTQAAPAPVVRAARGSTSGSSTKAKDAAPAAPVAPATPATAAKTTVRNPGDQTGRHILNTL